MEKKTVADATFTVNGSCNPTEGRRYMSCCKVLASNPISQESPSPSTLKLFLVVSGAKYDHSRVTRSRLCEPLLAAKEKETERC